MVYTHTTPTAASVCVQGTGYFARQPPMLYPRSDHKVRCSAHHQPSSSRGILEQVEDKTCACSFSANTHHTRSVAGAHLQSVPLGNTVYLLGGLTNALELEDPTTADAAPGAAPAVPLVLNATVAYDTYTETSRQLAPMPQPR